MGQPRVTDDRSRETIASYDRYAEAFRDRRVDRAGMTPAYQRFGALLGTGSLVLDAGCGPAVDRAGLAAHGHRVFGMDRSSGMLDVARRDHPGQYVLGDLRAVPYRDNTFDGVWANGSVLHLPREDAPAALSGFARVVRPGGALFISLKPGQGDRPIVGPDGPDQRRHFTYWPANPIFSPGRRAHRHASQCSRASYAGALRPRTATARPE
jgi:ubiquinone/menaquinone biosynthesis C-methylase UbiE